MFLHYYISLIFNKIKDSHSVISKGLKIISKGLIVSKGSSNGAKNVYDLLKYEKKIIQYD